MPRKKVLLLKNGLFHINARSVNREWFGLAMEPLWQVFSDYLYLAHHFFNMEIYSFLLMSNHFHLIAKSPDENLSETMNYFMRETSRVIGDMSGRINQIYGARYHKSLITSSMHFAHVYKYVYRNPVEAGLTDKVENYPYSTLQGLLGKRQISIPIQEDKRLFDFDSANTLNWLNAQYLPGHKEQVQNALRKSTFEFALNKNTSRKSELEDILS